MSRKAFVACLLLALSATAAASQAAAQTKLSVAKVANDFALSMADYGNKLGTFQKNGLAVTVSEITQAKMIQATIGGSVDIALASGATLAFAAKGAPLTGVAALSGPPSILVLVVAPKSPITSIDQLRHRTVAVSNLGSLTDWAVSQIALHEHWPSADIKRVSVGDTGARIATLRTGAADAAVVDIAAAFNLEERGEAKISRQFRRPDRKIPKPDRLRVQRPHQKEPGCGAGFRSCLAPDSRLRPRPSRRNGRVRPETAGGYAGGRNAGLRDADAGRFLFKGWALRPRCSQSHEPRLCRDEAPEERPGSHPIRHGSISAEVALRRSSRYACADFGRWPLTSAAASGCRTQP